MARPQKPKNNQSNVVSMGQDIAGNVAVAEPEPATPFDPPITNIPPAAPAPKKNLTFWERVNSIPKADWGTRAFIYVYCLEPICNLKLGGESKYLVRLGEPIVDEQSLMVDYGSGKYRLQLVNRKAAADKADAIDTKEIEIYNPKYPPKIPRSVWMNDPRNERWAALLPKEEPPQPATPLGAVSDAFRTFTDIQRNIREELTPPAAPAPPPPPDPVAQFKGMLQAAKEMMPAPAPATDNKVLDTVVQLMMKQLDASQQETKELRQELRDVMKARQNDHGETFETILDKFEKIAPKLTNILGLAGEKATDVVHGRRRAWWEDMLATALPQLAPGMNSLMGAAANYFLMPKNGNAGLGGQQAQSPAGLPAPTNGQQQAPPDPLQPLKQKVGNFLGANLMTVQKFFDGFMQGKASQSDPDSKMDGEDLAIWINEGNPQILRDIRTLGSANIVLMFQAAPAIWAAIAPNEAKFRAFLDQVLSFAPDEEEEAPEPPAPGQPVDLTA